MCCVCAGMCNHVGAHSYCAAHGGSPYVSPVVITPHTTPIVYMEPPGDYYREWIETTAELADSQAKVLAFRSALEKILKVERLPARARHIARDALDGGQ